MRDPLVGRDVLVGVAAGTIAALLIASRLLIPRAAGWPLATPQLPEATILLGDPLRDVAGARDAAAGLQPMQIVGIVVFLKILVRRNWLVMLLGTRGGAADRDERHVCSASSWRSSWRSRTGIALVFTVLLRFGLLVADRDVLHVPGHGSASADDRSVEAVRQRIGAVSLAIAAISVYGFYASRGDEPLFGRPLLD